MSFGAKVLKALFAPARLLNTVVKRRPLCEPQSSYDYFWLA
jgi:hypothetical protein